MVPPLLRVALVDDEEPVCRALARLVASAGFDAQTFASGVEFLEAMPIQGLRCAVVDIHMPGLDGLEVHARLAHSWPEVPVILITGHEGPEPGRRALVAPPLAFLKKPVDSGRLFDAIGNIHGPVPIAP